MKCATSALAVPMADCWSNRAAPSTATLCRSTWSRCSTSSAARMPRMVSTSGLRPARSRCTPRRAAVWSWSSTSKRARPAWSAPCANRWAPASSALCRHSATTVPTRSSSLLLLRRGASVTGPGDWVIPSNNISAPVFLGPNDAGIVFGPDVPPCMAGVYSGIFRFQPAGGAVGGLDAPPSMYFGQLVNPPLSGAEGVDIGYLIYDGAAVCGYRVMIRFTGQNRIDGTGTIWAVTQFGGVNLGTLPKFFRDEFHFGDTSGAPSGFINVVEVNINKGDPLTRTPNPRNTLLTVDSVSLARGLRDEVSSAVNSAAIGAEAVALTGPAMTFFDTRCYQVWAEVDAFGSVANNPAINIRQINLAGAILLTGQFKTAAGTAFGHVVFTGNIRRTAGTDLTDNLVLTLQAAAGTVTQRGAATALRRMEIRDIGASADYPNAISI